MERLYRVSKYPLVKIGVGEAVSEYRDSALVCVYIGTTSMGLGF